MRPKYQLDSLESESDAKSYCHCSLYPFHLSTARCAPQTTWQVLPWKVLCTCLKVDKRPQALTVPQKPPKELIGKQREAGLGQTLPRTSSVWFTQTIGSSRSRNGSRHSDSEEDSRQSYVPTNFLFERYFINELRSLPKFSTDGSGQVKGIWETFIGPSCGGPSRWL